MYNLNIRYLDKKDTIKNWYQESNNLENLLGGLAGSFYAFFGKNQKIISIWIRKNEELICNIPCECFVDSRG